GPATPADHGDMVHRRVRARWVGHDRVGDIVTDHGLPAGVPLDVERPERSQRIASRCRCTSAKAPNTTSCLAPLNDTSRLRLPESESRASQVNLDPWMGVPESSSSTPRFEISPMFTRWLPLYPAERGSGMLISASTVCLL